MDLDALNRKGQAFRARYLGGLFGLLTRCRIKAINITAFRLLGGVAFVVLLPAAPKTAFMILIAAGLLDWIDGGLARYQQQTSDRGKFWDVLVDHTNYVLAVFAFIRLGVFSPVILSYHLLIVPILFLLATIKESEHRQTDWIIYPFYGIVYFKPVSILAIFLYLWYGIDVVNVTLLLMNTVMTLLAARYAFILHRRWKHLA